MYLPFLEEHLGPRVARLEFEALADLILKCLFDTMTSI